MQRGGHLQSLLVTNPESKRFGRASQHADDENASRELDAYRHCPSLCRPGHAAPKPGLRTAASKAMLRYDAAAFSYCHEGF
jgi:hypothetical protein